MSDARAVLGSERLEPSGEEKMLNMPELAIRELDHRRADGIDVRLLWNSRTNRVSIAVEDERSGETFVLDVPSAEAREAFKHPYAYIRADRYDEALAA
jgi:hypothetical protein